MKHVCREDPRTEWRFLAMFDDTRAKAYASIFLTPMPYPWVITGAPGFASATMGNKYADDVSALVRIRGPLPGRWNVQTSWIISLCRRENDDHRENLRVTVILSNSHDSLSVIAYLNQHEKGMGVAQVRTESNGLVSVHTGSSNVFETRTTIDHERPWMALNFFVAAVFLMFVYTSTHLPSWSSPVNI